MMRATPLYRYRAMSSSLPRHSQNPPAATSTSAAQPFSTPLTPAPSSVDKASPGATTSTSTPAPSTATTAAVKSSVAAGTVLKGLNFYKNKQDPLAKEDSEYPSWLWGLLAESGDKKKKGGAGGVDEGDLFCESRWRMLLDFLSFLFWCIEERDGDNQTDHEQPSPRSSDKRQAKRSGSSRP